MKRLTLLLTIYLLLFIPTISHTQTYSWHPKQPEYTVSYKSVPVYIYFIEKKDWPLCVRKYWERVNPWEMGGFHICRMESKVVNGKVTEEMVIKWHKVFIRKTEVGEVNLYSFGHEMAHVFDGQWHNKILEEEEKE